MSTEAFRDKERQATTRAGRLFSLVALLVTVLLSGCETPEGSAAAGHIFNANAALASTPQQAAAWGLLGAISLSMAEMGHDREIAEISAQGAYRQPNAGIQPQERGYVFIAPQDEQLPAVVAAYNEAFEARGILPITDRDVFIANPELRTETVHKGDRLFIPFKGYTSNRVADQDSANKNPEKGYVLVAPEDVQVSGLVAAYNEAFAQRGIAPITIRDVYMANPKLQTDTVRKGDKLFIPFKGYARPH